MIFRLEPFRCSQIQKRAFEAIRQGAHIRPHLPDRHFLVDLRTGSEFLAHVKLKGEICLKYVFNPNKDRLIFEGNNTLSDGHAQHDELAKEIWGPYGFRHYDIQGGYLHVKHVDGKFVINFYSYSATFAGGGGEIDHDEYVSSDGGQWARVSAARKLTSILSAGADNVITDKGTIDFIDPEDHKPCKAYSLEVQTTWL